MLDAKRINREALDAAARSLDQLLNGGFSGYGCIPPHFKRTRESTEASLSLVRLAIHNDEMTSAEVAK